MTNKDKDTSKMKRLEKEKVFQKQRADKYCFTGHKARACA
jgi:hypothetical protein